MIFTLRLIMQASPTSSTTSSISISYSLIFLCKIFISILGDHHLRWIFLYGEYKEMSLYDFCGVCKLPFEGSIEEPHRNDVEGFIDMIAVGETRKVCDARITSIHFPVLRYFAIFASRCLIGRGNCGNLSAPDIVILCHALFHDNTFSLGTIVAKQLNLNHTKGPIFGGIFASRLAKYFEIPIRHYEKEEKVLPPIYLDYKSMILAHDFLCYDKEKRLIFNLAFS